MLKYLLLALSLFFGTVTAQGNDVIIENLDGSHFQRTDIFQGKISGQGKCTVSGSRNWNGGCSLEQFTMGPLNRYEIYLNDEKSYYRIVQDDPGNNDLYHTKIDGRDVKTTIERVSDRDAIFTIGDMKVHIMLEALKVRTDPAFSRESADDDNVAFMIMARGQGTCKLSGTRSFSGNCNLEMMARGMLEERYDIQLDDAGKTRFSILKLTDGSKGYVTRIDGKDVATAVEDIRTVENFTTESIFSFGDDLKLHIDLKKIQIRSGP